MPTGQRFYIKTDTLGIHSSNGQRVLVVIPKHAIVEILSETFNSSRMIDVTWEGQPRMMFVEDLREHGKEIADFKHPTTISKVVHYQDICFLDSNAEVSHREATIRLRVVRKTGTPLPIESDPIGKEDSMNGYHPADGKTMTGNFTQGPGTFPFKFSRTGDPKVEEVKASPAVAKDFLGTWEGTLEGPGLRLVLKISNEASGAKAMLIFLDQGGTEIPVSVIDQKDSKLTLLVKMVGGQYEAEINKEGSELNGTWTQGGNGLPLKLKKAAAQDKKP